MLCVISRGNWDNGSNAGSRNRNLLQGVSHQIRDRRNAARPERLCHGLVADPGAGSPILSRQCFAIQRDQNSPALIPKLLAAQRPSAVFNVVWPVVVDSLQRVFFSRWMTHVGNKSLKRGAPRVTNCDAAPAVVFEKRVVRVFAALLHAGPPAVERLMTLCARNFTCFGSCCAGLFAQASARLHVAALQIGRAQHLFYAAIAKAEISPPSGDLFGLAFHEKPSEFFPSQVQQLRHWHLSFD